MPRVRVRQLEERIATSGVHFGLGPKARKLEPGEVIDIPEGELFEQVWNTGKLELTRDSVTRPLTYENELQAKLCSPTFKPRGPDEADARELALGAVAERLDMEQLPEESEATPKKRKPATRRRSVLDQKTTTA